MHWKILSCILAAFLIISSFLIACGNIYMEEFKQLRPSFRSMASTKKRFSLVCFTLKKILHIFFVWWVFLVAKIWHYIVDHENLYSSVWIHELILEAIFVFRLAELTSKDKFVNITEPGWYHPN